MSADNGVYVLFTDPDKGPEYRVAYASAIGNIYGQFNEELNTYDGNVSAILSTFKDSEVFYSLNEALDYAEQLEYEKGETEDGVCVINEFKDYGHIFA